MNLIAAFLTEMRALGPYWGVWLKTLGLLNFAFPLFFIFHPLAQMTVIVFLLQAVLMLFLFSIYGFVPLLGVAHFGWFFLIYVFIKNLPKLGDVSAGFRFWFFTLMIINGLSLIIDVYDVGRYFLK